MKEVEYKKVSVPILAELLRDSAILKALYNNGVINWEWYDDIWEDGTDITLEDYVNLTDEQLTEGFINDRKS